MSETTPVQAITAEMQIQATTQEMPTHLQATIQPVQAVMLIHLPDVRTQHLKTLTHQKTIIPTDLKI
jgi:hypothetical protein